MGTDLVASNATRTYRTRGRPIKTSHKVVRRGTLDCRMIENIALPRNSMRVQPYIGI